MINSVTLSPHESRLQRREKTITFRPSLANHRYPLVTLPGGQRSFVMREGGFHLGNIGSWDSSILVWYACTLSGRLYYAYMYLSFRDGIKKNSG